MEVTVGLRREFFSPSIPCGSPHFGERHTTCLTDSIWCAVRFVLKKNCQFLFEAFINLIEFCPEINIFLSFVHAVALTKVNF